MYRSVFFLAVLFSSLLTVVQTSVPARSSVIIDTDVDIDDLWAISYLLQSGKMDVLAITVSANGWSDPLFTVPNVYRILQLVGCPSEDQFVAYGSNSLNTLLEPAGTNTGTVPLNLKVAIDKFLTNCINLTLDLNDHPSPYYATELIPDILRSSTEPVNFLVLGGFTNLARVIVENRDLVHKIGTVYFSGASFDGRPPAVNVTWPYTSKTKGSSWNIFVDPLAAQLVFESGVKIVIMTSQAQADLPINVTAIAQYGQTYNVDPVWQNIVTLLAPCSGQTEADIDYWDPSAAMLMEQLETGISPALTICTNWTNYLVEVVLTDGGSFGRTLVSPNGNPAVVCNHADPSKFEPLFWQALGGTTPTCLKNITVSFAPDTSDLQLIIDVLQQNISHQQQTIQDLSDRLSALENRKSGSANLPLSLFLSCFLFLLGVLANN